jgi:RNA polymerase sigma factor (TIGR02999 family)
VQDPIQPTDVASSLARLRAGDRAAFDALFRLLYDDLRVVARQQRRDVPWLSTLGTTALLHEGFLRLWGADGRVLVDQDHFLALAARAMRNVVVDYVRARTALKRGGGDVAATLDERIAAEEASHEEVLEFTQVLERLDAVSPRMAQALTWRFLGGLDENEIAKLQQVTPRTVRRDLQRARLWVHHWRTAEPGNRTP